MGMDYKYLYDPTPDEIKKRIHLTDLMREYGWDCFVIDEIMHHDNPTVKTVFLLINKHGPIVAHDILKRFIK